MKKYVLIFALLTIGNSTSICQIRFDAFVGINPASLHPNESGFYKEEVWDNLEKSNSNSILPFVGLRGQYTLHHRFLLNFETQVSLKGQKWKNPDHNEVSTYIDFIPSVKVKVVEGLYMGFGGFIGVRAHTKFNDYEPFLGPSYKYRRPWDYGGLFSMEYLIKKITLRASYFHGINTIGSGYESFDGGNLYLSYIYRHRVFQLGIGYRLNDVES